MAIPSRRGSADSTEEPTADAPVPASFKCPITHEVMRDPVQTADGQVYERKAIEGWFHRGHQTSPVTNLVLPSVTLLPVPALKRAIEEVKASTKELEAELRHWREEPPAVSAVQRQALHSLIAKAVKKGDAYVVRGLWDAVPGAVDSIRGNDQLARKAVLAGHAEVVEVLAELGSPLTYKDKDGRSLVHMAALRGHAPTCEVLARFGTPLHAIDSLGDTPAQLAVVQNRLAAAQTLVRLGAPVQFHDGHTLLHVAAIYGDDVLMKALVDLGVPLDGRDVAGSSPVMVAAFIGRTEAVRALAHLGAHLGGDSATPAHLAVLGGQAAEATLTELAKLGAPLNVADVDGAVPAIVRHLLHGPSRQLREVAAQIPGASTAGSTPAHLAAAVGNIGALEVLRRSGVSLDEGGGADRLTSAHQQQHGPSEMR